VAVERMVGVPGLAEEAGMEEAGMEEAGMEDAAV
jgi:inhibitor of KinA sporulation pathway (predicted exonuclease)